MMEMVAVDTSSLVAFLEGDEATDVRLITDYIKDDRLLLPPPVLSEILSDPNMNQPIAYSISMIPTLEMKDGFWQRAGELRRSILKRNMKIRLEGPLIAQFCIDNQTPLLTRDKDFRHFSNYCDLELVRS